MNLEDHPTVQWYCQQEMTQRCSDGPTKLDPQWLKNLCIEAGAVDAGFVETERSAIADQMSDLMEVFPAGKTLICIVHGLNHENMQNRSTFCDKSGISTGIEGHEPDSSHYCLSLTGTRISSPEPASGIPNGNRPMAR